MTAPVAERDRRGALPLLVVGGAGLVASFAYGVTKVSMGTIAPMFFFGMLALVLLLAGFGRWFCGRALRSPISRHAEQLDRTGFGGQLRRLGAFIADVILVGGFTAFTMVAVRDLMPYGSYDYRWSMDGDRWLSGSELMGRFWPHMWTSRMADELGPALAMLLVGALWLVPAATWGATPGMLIFGRLWARHSDGKRVGAVHGVVRALGTAALSPLQAFLVVISILGTGQRYRQVGTGRVYYGRWAFLKVVTARRSVADVFFRTETAPRFRVDDGRG